MVAFFYGVPTFINDLVEITRSEAVGRAWPLFYLVYYFLTPGALAMVKSYFRPPCCSGKNILVESRSWRDRNLKFGPNCDLEVDNF